LLLKFELVDLWLVEGFTLRLYELEYVLPKSTPESWLIIENDKFLQTNRRATFCFHLLFREELSLSVALIRYLQGENLKGVQFIYDVVVCEESLQTYAKRSYPILLQVSQELLPKFGLLFCELIQMESLFCIKLDQELFESSNIEVSGNFLVDVRNEVEVDICIVKLVLI